MSQIIAPTPDPDRSAYAWCRLETPIAVPAAEFLDWWLEEPIENFMKGTALVPQITNVELQETARWRDSGSQRMITFSDKTSALERIVSTDYPHSYDYQPYAFTSPLRLLTDYAWVSVKAKPDGDGMVLVWDYGFHARNALALPVLKLFVSFDWKRNMTNGVALVKEHLEAHGTSMKMHEAPQMEKAA